MKPLIILLLFFSHHLVYGQTQVVLKINPSSSTHLPCPLTNTTYTVGVSSGTLPACTYRWTIDGGKIEGSTSGTSVTVKWNDLPGQGTLTVTAGSCAATVKYENGNSATAKITRHSVFGQNFPSGACNSSIDVPLCSTSAFAVCVNKMYIQNTNSKEVDAYIWYIPAGFRQQNTTNVGPITITSTSNAIVLEPINSIKGTVTVRATVKNSCGQVVQDSNPTSIDIIRTPLLSIAAHTPDGTYTARCGAVDPITFSIPALACATSYAWDIPDNWTGTSSSTSIQVTPSGSNGGVISVNIGLSTGHSTTFTRTINYTDDPPAALQITNNSGVQELCAGESFTYTATVPTGYSSSYGFDWYADSGILINGLSSSSYAPIHTTTNSITVSALGQTYGTKFIRARLNNLSCAAGYYGWIQTRVGVYSNEEFSIVGPSAVCPNSVADYSSSYMGGDLTGYEWSAPNGWSSSGQGTPYFSVSVPYNFTGNNAAITLRLGNRCGYTNTPYVKTLSLGVCGFSVSPNPASSTLTVSDLNLNEDETAEARIVNKNGKAVQKGRSKNGQIDIDVSTLPNGPYVLIVDYKGKTESKNILVSH